MTKVNDYQLRQMVCSLAGSNVEDYTSHSDMDEFMNAVQLDGSLNLPGWCSIYVIPERTAVLAAITKPKGSWLIRQLLDRPLDIAVVVDSMLTGANAIFIVGLGGITDARDWLAIMRNPKISFTIRPIDNECNVLVAAASCFIGK